jgi:hypothetical protein
MWCGRVDRPNFIPRPRSARKPPVDCFYVYPTVSGQQTDQADLTIDPEQRAIARYQASRYSETCRVFAPMYRQLTLLGLLEPDKITPEMKASTYQDVVDAWHQYLSKYNRGRGVIFIGHSQGSFVLRQLLHDEVDPKPSVLSRLVAADLIGGNVLVAKGKDIGGSSRARCPMYRRRGSSRRRTSPAARARPTPMCSRSRRRVARASSSRSPTRHGGCTSPT